jgi:hypothetical protein
MCEFVHIEESHTRSNRDNDFHQLTTFDRLESSSASLMIITCEHINSMRSFRIALVLINEKKRDEQLVVFAIERIVIFIGQCCHRLQSSTNKSMTNGSKKDFAAVRFFMQINGVEVNRDRTIGLFFVN